jgi:DNA polymerase III, subunit gamma and tau
MEQFVVSARKYRPQQFGAILGQDNIALTLKNAILRKQLAHAYLFCGPRGVGKTTSARIFAKTINCLNPTPEMEACGVCESCRSFAEGRSYCIHELDAASNNSVEDIRQLIEKVRIPPQIGSYSVYIIDEVHMLSQSAFNAFLKTLEEPPSYALFILATTEKHKILPTILSRCQTFDFNRIGISEMVKMLSDIAQKEEIKIDDEALHVMAAKADGAMRDALTLFDQTVAFCGHEISYQQVISNLNVLDYEYYFKLTKHFLLHEYSQALTLFDELLSKGFNALHFVGGLSQHFRDLLVSKDPATLALLELSPGLCARYGEQAKECNFAFLYEALRICAACEAGYKTSGNPRLHVELSLIRLSHIGMGPQVSAAPTSAPASTPASTSPVTAQPAQTSQASQASQASIPAAPKPTKPKPVEPKPTPGSAVTPSFSINALLKQEEKKNIDAQASFQLEPDVDPFDLAQLLIAWKQMAQRYESRPRLLASLLHSQPRLEDSNLIFFEVESDLQKDWMEQHCVVDMLASLKTILKNDLINLQLEVKSADEKEQVPYMPEDKARVMLSQHPEIQELKNDLKLDLL